MNTLLETSINEICHTFCKECDYEDCVEIEKGIYSVIFGANEKKTGSLVCFKIIPEAKFNENKEEWDVLELLRKFSTLFFEF
jgi:hypothetical protein